MTGTSSKSSEIQQLVAGCLELAGETCLVCSMQMIPKESVQLCQLKTNSSGPPKPLASVTQSKNSSSDNPATRARSHLRYCINMFLFL